MTDEQILHDAISFWTGEWPPELYSGVMFYKGLRITKQQFDAATKGQS